MAQTVALRPPGEGERPARIHLEDHGHDGIVLVADDDRVLRLADSEALTLADDLTILAERRQARGRARR